MAACKHCEQMQQLVGEMGDEIVRLNKEIENGRSEIETAREDGEPERCRRSVAGNGERNQVKGKKGKGKGGKKPC